MAYNSLGLIELTSIAAGFQSCDAMLKAANVQLVKTIQIGGAFVTAIVQGDVGSVKAAVDAGAAAAQRSGELVAAHVIARPTEGLINNF